MSPAQPWYREPWPWILMAGPAAVVVAGTITAWVAYAGADGLVADDYYKRGLAINAVLRREQEAARRGITARVVRAKDSIAVYLTGAAPEALQLRLAHATRAGYDLRLRLARAADGAYRADLPPLAAGRWRAVVDDPRGDWRVVQEDL